MELYRKKSNQRWLWHAIDHEIHNVLAYHFGSRKYHVFKTLKTKLSLFDIDIFYSDDWGAYKKYLPVKKHIIGKRNTQAIERLNLTFGTRIKRLCRKIICFSKLKELHDTVIGLFINVTEFGNSIKSLSTF